MSSPAEFPRIAVAIPCYNEAAAIGRVVAEWLAALPAADVIVFDNNSTDGTGTIAQEAGARVVAVPEQGKGHAVRAIFKMLADRAAVVLVDGDGTYPAGAIGELLPPVLEGRADMAVGSRRPVAGEGAMTPLRRLGNLLIPGTFRVFIGRGTRDLLSGYRVFGPRFLHEVRLRSSGFEIETELATEAVARHLRIVEIPVDYHPRIAGTASKLRPLRDGIRIVRTIVVQSLRLRPWRPALLAAGLVLGVIAALKLLR
ncbi:MAG: glycosyltransferase [Isosphaeraceae bacterium]|nr:glycosyltransferase [Isosphaeraceae bacterium]